MSQKLTIDLIITRSNNKNLDSIKTLNLWGCNLSDISILSKLTSLETLSLSKNQIKDISVFKSLKNLKELYLKGNQISDWDQINNLKYCKKLEKLVLKENPISKSPNYPKKVLELLPQLIKLDDKEINLIKNNIDNTASNQNEINENDINKKMVNSITYENFNYSHKIDDDSKDDQKGNFAAPAIGSNYFKQNQIINNGSENGKNIDGCNFGMVDPQVGNPKISAKTLEVFNKSFRKKKTGGTFFKLKHKDKKDLNKSGNILNENDISMTEKENNNILTNSRLGEDQYNTLTTSFSLQNYKVILNPNFKKDGYKKKIIGNYNSKLNQSTYLKYQQFDNEKEEEKKKETSTVKNMNRSFYQIYSKGLLAYNKKTIDKKENSFYIYNNNNSNSNEKNKNIIKNKEINVNNEKKDKDQKIIQSLQLLISTLSLDGLKEVQNEVQKLLSSKMK
jgi:hypothetical protein